MQRRAQLRAADEVLEASRLALESSRERYAAGLATYQNVLTSLTASQQAELSVLEAARALLGAHLDLRVALGSASREDPGASP